MHTLFYSIRSMKMKRSIGRYGGPFLWPVIYFIYMCIYIYIYKYIYIHIYTYMYEKNSDSSGHWTLQLGSAEETIGRHSTKEALSSVAVVLNLLRLVFWLLTI